MARAADDATNVHGATTAEATRCAGARRKWREMVAADDAESGAAADVKAGTDVA